MSFRWNIKKESRPFWDPMFHSESTEIRSDKEVLERPLNGRTDDVLQALCNVVIELVERAEKTAAADAQKLAKELEQARSRIMVNMQPDFHPGMMGALVKCRGCGLPKAHPADYCAKCGL